MGSYEIGNYDFYGSGDVNQDGRITISDAAEIAKYVVNLRDYNMYMNVLGNNNVQIRDAAHIAKAVVNLVTLPPPLPFPFFKLDNINTTNNTAILKLNTTSIPDNVTSIGAFEIEFRNADLTNINIPSTLVSNNSYYLKGPQRFVYANTDGIDATTSGIFEFDITFDNNVGIELIENRTKLWDNSSNVNLIMI
uniref:Dockerin domain-containing protein n=1 Tax=viral metagenome TaxID=1070528 RepID=A0A6C0F931_9ZZZZ|tara:strand:- start:25345 stop:25923 length:579 start_codon:yes stop_codon:yes gene_type:complete